MLLHCPRQVRDYFGERIALYFLFMSLSYRLGVSTLMAASTIYSALQCKVSLHKVDDLTNVDRLLLLCGSLGQVSSCKIKQNLACLHVFQCSTCDIF